MQQLERFLLIWVIFSLLMLAAVVPVPHVLAQHAARPRQPDAAGKLGALWLASHFDAMQAGDEATAALAAGASITVTAADDGKTVQVAAGGRVAVALAGNPTTGYIWQVTANDESILAPEGYRFVPESEAPGAGGMEQFSFHAMAPGTVALALANSRPSELDTLPVQTLAVTVEVAAGSPGDTASLVAGMAENGKTVAILPGHVLNLGLAGAANGRVWQLVAGDAMVAQTLGVWQQTPDATDPTKVAFVRDFLGVAPGKVELKFAYTHAGTGDIEQEYALTVEVPPTAPGSSGAVAITEADAGKDFALVTGDTLVVRLAANLNTGYTWRVVSPHHANLPAAGDLQYAENNELIGGAGVATFRFLAKAPGVAMVQLGEFPWGAGLPERTLAFTATIAAPALLTGNTITATEVASGQPIDLAAGNLLKVSLAANLSTGYWWRVTANNGALLRLLPAGGFTPTSDQVESVGTQDFIFRALGAGQVALQIAEFAWGAGQPDTTLDYTVRIGDLIWLPLVRRQQPANN